MRKLIFGLCIIVGASGVAGAQEPNVGTLSLQAAVERVQRAGFDVRIAAADARVAAAEAASAGAALRPQAGISGVLLDANEPQLGMPIARQAYAGAMVSVPVYAPSTALAARSARASADAAQTSIAAAANDAVFAAVQAYRRVQLADAVAVARRAAAEDQTAHLRLTEERVAAGKAARYLLLRDRAALASAQQALEDALAERAQARNDLAALLDLPPVPLVVEPLERRTFNETRETVLARALRQRPSLLAAEQRLSALRLGVAAARSAYRPAATLTAQSYNGASSPRLGSSGGQVQLTASLPVFDGGSRAAAVSKEQAQYERALAVRDQARTGVVRDVANAWREYEASTRNLATATAVQADAQEQLRLAMLRQSAGKAIEVEVLDALAAAAGARESVVRSIARFDVAIAAIHHAAGDLSP
jgi:outer membrane protein TolC